MEYVDKYLPVDPDFSAGVAKKCIEGKNGKIHFFNEKNEVDGVSGTATCLITDNYTKYIQLDNNQKVRLDKIITLFGKPGPAYEQYDRYANTCLTCEKME